MEMEKFNSSELKIFNLVREGKTRDEISASGITTPANLNNVLIRIYEKTDGIVNYHTARNKYKELQCFLRNNPNVFTPIPDTKPDVQISDEKPKNHTLKGIIVKLEKQYKQLLETNNAKLSVLDDVAKELEENLKNARIY